jgi:hypothetical protein
VSVELEVVRGEVVPTLAENKAAIHAKLDSFVEVGTRLAIIRDERQFVEDGFDTFEAFCEAEFDLDRQRPFQLIAAAGMVSTLVDTHGLPPPRSERVVRPLVKLYNARGNYDPSTKIVRDPERGEREVVAAWSQIIEQAGDAPITSRVVTRFLTHGATYGKPGWFELVGIVGEHLIAAGKAMDKADAAVTRKPNAKLQGKLADYAGWARALADRLDAMREWRE